MDKPLNVAEMTSAAAEVVSKESECEFVGVSTAGGRSYAELLLRVLQPDGDTQRVSIGLFRDVPLPEFRREVSRKLRALPR